MQVRVLGDLLLDEGGVPAPTGRRRELLLLLVAHAGHGVTSDRLIDLLWQGEAPATARNAVQVQVHHLRRLLGTRWDDPIVTDGDRYRLQVPRDEIDWCRFEALVNEAEAAGEGADHDRARRVAEAALDLWRGEPFPEADPSGPLGTLATRLRERHRQAVVLWADHALRMGRAAAVAARLSEDRVLHRFDEDLHVRLAVALTVSGRQGDALRVLDRLRRELLDELGLDPAPAVGVAEHAILEQADDLVDRCCPVGAASGPAPSPAPTSGTDPRLPTLDRTVPFVGRDAVLGDIVDERLVWLVGPSGRGKSRTLVEIAERERSATVAYVRFERFTEAGGSTLGPLLPPTAAEAVASLALTTTPPEETARVLVHEAVRASGDTDRLWLVDDAQWAGPFDRLLLDGLALAVASGTLPARLVVASRTGTSAPGADAPAWREIALDPLGDDDMATLLPDAAADVVGACSGEPVLAMAARQLTVAAPGRAEELVALAVDRLMAQADADAGTLVDLAAVTPTPLAADTVRSITGWDARRLGAARLTAQGLGLVVARGDAVELAHERWRRALVDRLGRAARDRLARAVVEAEEAEARPPDGLRRLWMTGDGSRAAQRGLVSAGRDAIQSLSYDAATRIGDLLIELSPPGSVEWIWGNLLGQADRDVDHANEPPSAALAMAAAMDADDELLMLEAGRALTGRWTPEALDDDRLELLDAAAARAQRPGPRAGLLALIVISTLGRHPDARAMTDDALRLAEADGDPTVRCVAEHAWCYARLGRAPAAQRITVARRTLDRARGMGLVDRAVAASAQLLVAGLAAGDDDAVGDALAAHGEAAELTGRPLFRWRALVYEAAVAMAGGFSDDARRLAADAAAIGRDLGFADARVTGALQRFCIDVLDDRLDDLRPLGPPDDPRPLAAASVALVSWVRGDLPAAHAAVDHLHARLAAESPDYLTPPALALGARLAIETGREDLRDLVDDLVRRHGLAGEQAVVAMGVGTLGLLPAPAG